MIKKSRKQLKKSGKYGKTRKISTKCEKTMSLPELRKSLQYIESYAKKALATTDNMRSAAVDFANEWYAVFQKKLDVNEAMEYLKHATTYSVKGEKGQKGQKGGDAPLDYTMRPGTLPPYGNFLPYVEKGFDVGIPEMSSTALAAQGGTPTLTPYPDTGSNAVIKGGKRRTFKRKMAGGSFLDTIKQVFTHPPGQSPPSVLSDVVASSKGQTLGPGGDSTIRAYSYVAPSSTTALTGLYKNASVSSL